MGNHVLPKGKVNKCQFWAGVRTEKKSEQHAIARSLFAKVIKMQFVLEKPCGIGPRGTGNLRSGRVKLRLTNYVKSHKGINPALTRIWARKRTRVHV